MTKTELFLKLAQPDGLGYSRWVAVDEFVGGYSELKFGNGASWARKESTLAKKFKIEVKISCFNLKIPLKLNFRGIFV